MNLTSRMRIRSPRQRRRSTARWSGPAVMVVALLGATALIAPAAALAQVPPPEFEEEEIIPTPDQERSDDGTTVTAGAISLTASPVSGLDPSGQAVTVRGEGYDEDKGIYVAFCVLGARDETPSPCGGGAAVEGSTGASIWISSNPPRYGSELVVPWESGGSFETEVEVVAEFSDGTNDYDCREVQCAIVTRNDHTRPADRGQDLFVPVTFEGGDDPVIPADSVFGADANTDDAGAVDSSNDDSSGSTVLTVALVGAAVVLAIVVAAVIARRRRSQ